MRKDIEAKILERAHRAMKPVPLKEVESLHQVTSDVPKKKKRKNRKNKSLEKTTNNEIPVDDTIKKEKKKKKRNKKRSSPEEVEKEFRDTTNENILHSESFSEEETPNKKIKPEEAEEASEILKSADKQSEKKKKKKKDKGKKKEKEENPEHGVKRAAASLVYLQKWDTDRTNWKFEKLHQVWLLLNCLTVDRFPDSDFPSFLRYIAGMRGRAREEQIKTMNKIRSQHEEWTSIKEQTGKSDLELQEELKRNVTTPRMIDRCQQILDVLSNE